MIRHFFSSPRVAQVAQVVKVASISGLLLACAAGRAQAAPLVTSSDIWTPSQAVKGARPAFMTFDAARNALWTANAGNDTVSLRDARGGQLIKTVRVGHNPTCLSLDEARGTLWVVNADDATLYGIDTTSFAITAKLSTGKGAQLAAVDAKTGVVFIANCAGGTISVFNPASLQLNEVRVGGKPFGVAIDSARRRVYVANYAAGNVAVLDADSRAVIGQIKVAAHPITVAVDAPSGALFVTHSEAGTVGIVAAGAKTEGRRIETGGYPLGLGIDGERGRVYVADYDNQKLRVFDTNGNSQGDIDVAPAPTGLAFNAQSGRVFVCSEENNQLDVLDLQAAVRPEAAPLQQPARFSAAALDAPAETEETEEVEGENPNADQEKIAGSDFNTDLPVASEVEDNSVQRFRAAPLVIAPQTYNGFDGYSNGNTNGENLNSPRPMQPSRRPGRVRRPLRPQFETPGYEFEEAPAGGLGQRIALEAHKMQSSGAASGYHGMCDRLADTAIRRATRSFNGIVGPNPGDDAAKTMRRFQNAGIGRPYNAGFKLRAGDILYSGSQVGRGHGHVMIVGMGGKILDQYGINNRPTTRPNWVVRPDEAVRLASR